MRRKLIGVALASAALASAPAAAQFIPSPVLAGGGVALLNTASGTISICYRHLQLPPRCATVGTFATPATNAKILANEAGSIFYVYDSATGRTMRCDYAGAATATASGWTCTQLAATLP
jgi:hypothetical protein